MGRFTKSLLRYFNTTQNDLNYWGLDYPPLTAYHSLLCAHIAALVNPAWVELQASRGHESPEHKVFMRATDLLVFIPAVVVYCCYLTSASTNRKVGMLLSILLYPGLILIDYGHFQYNGLSLGLALWGVLGLGLGWEVPGAAAFCLALNYKQMELYHAVPFFCFLLGTCARRGLAGRGLLSLMKIGVTVLLTFALCWLPFLSDPEQALQVLRRVFPVARGLFEDKVANTWCSLNLVLKIRSLLSSSSQLYLSLAATLLAIAPSSLKLLATPTFWQFKLSLVNCSLAFFLFSYQVHEKSILLAALPVCLLLNDLPLVSIWFLQVSTFSTTLLAALERCTQAQLRLDAYHRLTAWLPAWLPAWLRRPDLGRVVRWKFYVSVAVMAALSVASVALPPPARLPDLFPVLVSTFSFLHFLGTFVYFNVVQLGAPHGGHKAR
ncbi:hypothetical protein CRUP_002323 [Coryphaenoides rupestris]|nr:hypothetical protein CRUP_002323 [Coryphaenoides rupestris]